MSNKLENICRLCLKVTEKEIEIDDIVKEMFEILLIKLDLGITRNPIICLNCMEVGKKCLGFKYTCIDTERIILSSCSDRIKLKHNIKDIYKESSRILIASSNTSHISCRICMTRRLERNNFVSFDTLINKSTFEMSKYMVEMDFNTTENPMICASCKEKLGVYFKFVLNCVDTEEKIKAYCLEKGTDRTEVRLGNVLQFMLTNISEYPNKCSQICKIKQNHMENTYSEAFSRLINRDELDIKDEGMILYNNSYRNATEFKLDKLAMYTDETKETQNSKKVIQTNTQDFHRNISVDKGVFRMFKCSLCAYKSKSKSNFKTHTLVHKDASEINMFKCSLCTYESKHKANVKHHMLVHKDVSEKDLHKCSLCSFESKHKRSLDLHMLVHKALSEIEIFKCSLCGFESRHKGSLKTHMIVHKDASEIKMFKCSLCAYKYKHRSSLQFHMLVHKDVSEIKMFKCSFCAYETRQKGRLKQHMLVHKDVSEIQMYKCSLCAYEAKQKCSLKTHMLVHKDISEINMFKCSLCTYESKYKGSLKYHMLTHKDVSEIKIFECSLCDFKSKHKGSLKAHMILHKDVSEINMFKCKLCSHECKLKRNLKSHMLVHKNVSEIEMFKCSLCTYECKRNDNLRRHMSTIHKDILEVKNVQM